MSKSTPPKSSATAFKEIIKILKMGWIDIPSENAFNGHGAPGDFLEHLLGGKKIIEILLICRIGKLNFMEEILY